MFPDFVGAVRDAYVKVARAELDAAKAPVSPDAIYVMTDVDQESADAILKAPDDIALPEAQQRMYAAARLLNGWHTDRDYIGPYGLVRDLAFAKSDANSKKEAGGFVELARKYTPTVNPAILLDELIRTACVQDLGNGFYRALTRSYVPEQLSAESLQHFAQVLHNVVDTLELNLRPPRDGSSRRLERAVMSDTLPKSELSAFDKYLRQRAQLFADDVDNWLTDRSGLGRENVVVTGVGFYHFVVNENDEKDFKKVLK
jgi:hypothetical protein